MLGQELVVRINSDEFDAILQRQKLAVSINSGTKVQVGQPLRIIEAIGRRNTGREIVTWACYTERMPKYGVTVVSVSGEPNPYLHVG